MDYTYRFIVTWLLLTCGNAYSETKAGSIEHLKWNIYGDTLYLRSNTGSLNVAGYRTNNNFDTYIVTGNIWGWGFKLGGTYEYQKDKDIDINWYSIDDQNTVYLSGPIVNSSGIFLNGPQIKTFNQAKWNAVNIEFAQHINSIKDTALRLYAGAEYVAINETLEFYSPGTGSDATYRGHAISYYGFGPRVGIDALYSVTSPLRIYSKTALGIYAGTSRENGTGNTADGILTGHNLFAMFIVPSIEEKLELNYTASIPSGELTVDTGWLWVNYFQALITRVGDVIHAENFGFQGPYLGLKWRGAMF